jgi:biopolymer transport protein ExbD
MSTAAQRQARHQRHRLQPGINLTPMLDILFNLIFFFVLTTNIRDETWQMKIELPRARTAAPGEQIEQVPVVSINAEGALFYQNRPVVEEELNLELKALAARGVGQIRLRIDAMARNGRVVEIMDFCRLAGIDVFSWDAEPASALPSGALPPRP